jgi:hypothetical protein
MTNRGFPLKLTAVIALIGAANCVSKDQPSVHLVTAYQLRGVTGGVQPEHSLDNLDGLGGYEILCELGSKIEDIHYSAAYDDDSLSIALDSSSNKTQDGESDCSITVKEDNTYQHDCVVQESKTVDCSKDATDSPCRVAIVEKTKNKLRGLICCKALPIQGKQPRDGDYSLFSPGSGDKPVAFSVYNCGSK